MEKESHFLCIDLKSFFASCECVTRGLDPFTTPLVVANKNQGNGAITLAVSPYLKQKGIKGRTRLYEIPKNIKYQIVNPRMKLYLEMSKKVVSIYLDYVFENDLHIYSIDECFLDVSSYLKMYQKSDYELALDILKTIKKKTGLTATCGIGPNMLLAKVAMDIEAKHQKNCLAKWTHEDIKTKLWAISPLSEMWGIGPRMEKRLNALGIFSVQDLALYDKYKLKDKFGIMGLELWNHANGIDTSKISDLKNITKEKSFSHSQVLFKDYYGENAKLIIEEMTEVLAARLRLNNYDASVIGLGISYSKNINDGFYHHLKLEVPTHNQKTIFDTLMIIFDRFYEDLPIRKISLSVGNLTKIKGNQLNLFEDYEEIKKEEQYVKTIDEVKMKFGKNSLLKASSLLPDSTIKERNHKIGGHDE